MVGVGEGGGGQEVAEFREKSILSLACSCYLQKSLTASGPLPAWRPDPTARGLNQNRASLFYFARRSLLFPRRPVREETLDVIGVLLLRPLQIRKLQFSQCACGGTNVNDAWNVMLDKKRLYFG